MRPDRVLIFVYNLDKGSLDGVKDHFYSTSQRESACKLCAFISSPVGMKKGWKRFIADLGITAEYLYREEFTRDYSLPGFGAPGIFLQLGGSLITLVSADEINTCESTDDLIDLVRKRIQKYNR